MHFNGEVTFGDVLTSATVLLAALTLYLGFWQARVQRQREIADVIRTAAADALAKLDRYARLPGSLTERAQDLVVEASGKIARASKPDDIRKARDYLWAELTKDWQEVRAAQRSEEIELSHVKLLGRRPEAYRDITEAIGQLDTGTWECFRDLLEAAQDEVLTCGRENNHQAAVIGNSLRSCLVSYEVALIENSERALAAVHTRLQAVISGSDKQVTDRKWEPVTPSN